jgi:hypothetical protein
MRHANKRPAGHIHGGEKAFPRHVSDAPLHGRVARNRAIYAWFPESNTSGTRQPLNSGGRV